MLVLGGVLVLAPSTVVVLGDERHRVQSPM